MLQHIFKADGFNHVLFHMEQSGDWEYRFRQVGSGIPSNLLEWSEPKTSTTRKVVVSPDACDHEVQVQWRYVGGKRWSKAALHEVIKCFVDLEITALVDIDLRDFTKGKRDMRFVAVVGGDVAAFDVDIDRLQMKAGERVMLKCMAISASINNIIVGDMVFALDSGEMSVRSIGESRKNFRRVSGPAIADVSSVDAPVFIAKSGGSMPESELKALLAELDVVKKIKK